MIRLLAHTNSADPMKLAVEEMPKPTDAALFGRNLHEKTGREVSWIEEGISTILIPWRHCVHRSPAVTVQCCPIPTAFA